MSKKVKKLEDKIKQVDRTVFRTERQKREAKQFWKKTKRRLERREGKIDTRDVE